MIAEGVKTTVSSVEIKGIYYFNDFFIILLHLSSCLYQLYRYYWKLFSSSHQKFFSIIVLLTCNTFDFNIFANLFCPAIKLTLQQMKVICGKKIDTSHRSMPYWLPYIENDYKYRLVFQRSILPYKFSSLSIPCFRPIYTWELKCETWVKNVIRSSYRK